MSTATLTTFASPGAQAEHYLGGIGRLTDGLGRVLRERLERFRRDRRRLTHEAVSVSREAQRARDLLSARAERTRLLAGRPAV
ncbi:hypothetical protein G5T42_13420 [Microbacterium sp. 4R-513]|uniref:hypothetical protein n=1 Tax=Microbacterium sp. 4R-513 TaxID=2567934 RepID=UPI0013E20572|nr:hypothetical protein [Microbacterium sp. 4R-513]QIG40350.1 hypothetical protein G5T42_13420 [Microbacterium sp. 4R-513]